MYLFSLKRDNDSERKVYMKITLKVLHLSVYRKSDWY